jgi:hypothetical protein
MPTRGTALDAQDTFREAMTYYIGEDYPKAAHALSALLRAEETSEDRLLLDQAAFFAGLCFLFTSHTDSAKVYLNLSYQSMQPVISDRSSWYLAQAYLLDGDPDRAVELLESLAERSPGYSRKASTQLLEIRRRQSR